MKKFILPGIIVISLVASIVAIGYGSMVVSGYESQMSAQNETIRDLEGQLTEMDKEASDKVEVKAVLNTAAQAGTEIAAYQTKFATMSDKDRENLDVVASEMRAMFSTSDSGATVPWYVGEDYTWHFETTYSFAGNYVPVVWLCRDHYDEVLAYATATYDVKEQVFKDVEWATVSQGNVRTSDDIDIPEGTAKKDIWKALIAAGQEKLATPTPSIDPDATPGPSATPRMADEYGRPDLPADKVAQSLAAGIPLPDPEPSVKPGQVTTPPEGQFSDFGVIG